MVGDDDGGGPNYDEQEKIAAFMEIAGNTALKAREFLQVLLHPPRLPLSKPLFSCNLFLILLSFLLNFFSLPFPFFCIFVSMFLHLLFFLRICLFSCIFFICFCLAKHMQYFVFLYIFFYLFYSLFAFPFFLAFSVSLSPILLLWNFFLTEFILPLPLF